LEAPNYNWTRAAEIINQAGKNWQAQRGDNAIETKDIDKEVSRLGDYSFHSVPPSGYCYNLINKGPSSFHFPLFEWLDLGKYRYLGAGYNYSGPILWKGRKVGEWKSGRFSLWEDPRE
jgi:hypothetical protein